MTLGIIPRFLKQHQVASQGGMSSVCQSWLCTWQTFGGIQYSKLLKDTLPWFTHLHFSCGCCQKQRKMHLGGPQPLTTSTLLQSEAPPIKQLRKICWWQSALVFPLTVDCTIIEIFSSLNIKNHITQLWMSLLTKDESHNGKRSNFCNYIIPTKMNE